MVFVKLSVKLCSQVHLTFALSPNSSLSFELDCESLKVPIFVVRVFFILIRNLDLQKVVCCIKTYDKSKGGDTRELQSRMVPPPPPLKKNWVESP